jgi:hypothetical protein
MKTPIAIKKRIHMVQNFSKYSIDLKNRAKQARPAKTSMAVNMVYVFNDFPLLWQGPGHEMK